MVFVMTVRGYELVYGDSINFCMNFPFSISADFFVDCWGFIFISLHICRLYYFFCLPVVTSDQFCQKPGIKACFICISLLYLLEHCQF